MLTTLSTLFFYAQRSQYEEIDVLMRPWVRLNGCINRRVLDCFLGSVLSFVMETPGIRIKAVGQKFWPALQPVQTYELLETLQHIDCIYKYEIVKNTKVSLFSNRKSIELGKDFWIGCV